MDIRYNTLRTTLAPRYGETEARAIALLVLEEAFGVERIDVYADKVRHFSSEEEQEWGVICKRLASGEPVQYVLGRATFLGRNYRVTPATLIPRPETEGLVALALQTAREIVAARGNNSALPHSTVQPPARPLHILDVGTGSGCIATSIALELRDAAHVEAWDISDDALDVARSNALSLGAEVEFRRVDILTADTTKPFDLIVSNPPYVLESERADMEDHVLAHEPASALFVPDDDPLRFYRALARLAQSCLAPGGTLAVEVNRAFADATAALFRSAALTAVTVHPDCFAAPRFVTGVRGEKEGTRTTMKP